MATLITLKEGGAEERNAIFKSLTTLGSDPDSDVILKGPDVAAVAAHITYDGNTYVIATSDKKREILVSGIRVRKQNLVDGDDIRIGDIRMRFSLGEKPEQAAKQEDDGQAREMEAYARLLKFSRALSASTDIVGLLDALMDEIVAITRADKGFLVLMEEGTPHVKVARNLKGESLGDAVAELSDTILAKVMRTQEAIVVSNALEDSEFNSSVSVLNLKLTSVMCAPLIHQGELLGAIYVGNNSVVNLFDDTSLALLTIFSGQAALLVQNALHINALTLQTKALQGELAMSRYGDIIGSCEGMKAIYKKVDKVAKADINVLITGETGTGKELIAREIHRRSDRASGPFIIINCGAIPENLLESELFGHVKGAFTGAVVTRAGRFQAANGGTLFLDEIGEMPLHLQVKILRAIQERTVAKVGDSHSENVDIRVLAATHRDLEEMIRTADFREDLYYRLNVVQLHLPALKERGEDVVVIANYLLGKYAEEFDAKVKGFTSKALTAIRKYQWPGNVRQLENRLKRAIVLCEKGKITPDDLDIQAEDLQDILSLNEATERFRRRYIDAALERNGNNRTKTARDLAVDPRTIFRHLESVREGEDPSSSNS